MRGHKTPSDSSATHSRACNSTHVFRTVPLEFAENRRLFVYPRSISVAIPLSRIQDDGARPLFALRDAERVRYPIGMLSRSLRIALRL